MTRPAPKAAPLSTQTSKPPPARTKIGDGRSWKRKESGRRKRSRRPIRCRSRCFLLRCRWCRARTSHSSRQPRRQFVTKRRRTSRVSISPRTQAQLRSAKSLNHREHRGSQGTLCSCVFKNFSARHWNINSRQKARLLPSLRQLLKRVGDLEQGRLAPRASKKADSDRQSPELSGCHVDIGIACDRSRA